MAVVYKYPRKLSQVEPLRRMREVPFLSGSSADCIGSGIAELSRVRFYETMTTTSGSAYWEIILRPKKP